MQEDIKIELSSIDSDSELKLPFEEAGIKAGFPSPAQDYMTSSLDLNRELVRHKETTFYARVSGNSLIDAGISDGDIIVIDKSLEATTGDYVVAFIDGEFTIKEFRLDEKNKCAWLIPYNKNFSPIKVTQENDFMIWGVVTYTIKKMTNHF
ncbi:MAG: translesion error-prone DNA polymerase V autoproteolytic subunit [Bacteroidaceae bacterium]|nr:translesion error-prone DNA polymerase V autoproteolytic subunit [Bacteroidaceae bacterium]